MSDYEMARQIGAYLASVHGLHFHVTSMMDGAELRVYRHYEDGVYSDRVWMIIVHATEGDPR